MRAADVMKADVLILDEGSSIAHAADLLLQRGYGGAPVHDEHGRIVGTVTCGDLLRALESGGTVRDLTRPAVTIAPDAPVVKVLNGFVRDRALRILVRDADGKLLGIITPTDVCRALAQARRAA